MGEVYFKEEYTLGIIKGLEIEKHGAASYIEILGAKHWPKKTKQIWDCKYELLIRYNICILKYIFKLLNRFS